MNRRSILSICAMTTLGLTLMPGSAFAQTAKDLVGTWKTVTNISIAPDGRRTDLFGSNPSAVLVFDANGRFVTVSTRPDLPKFASNNRMQGTAEENKAIVQGSIAYFGTYSVVDKVIIEKWRAVPGQAGSVPTRSERSPLSRGTTHAISLPRNFVRISFLPYLFY
jgi:hypothetical protein